MKKFIALFMCATMLNACATKELPMKAELIKSSSGNNTVEVTAEKIDDYSDEYNVLLQINLENKGGNWVRVDTAEIDLSNAESQPFNIVVGKDLVSWGEAKAEEKKMKAHNEDMSTMGVILAGGALAVAGILSKDSSLTSLGTVAYAGGTGWAVAKGFSDMKKNVQGVAKVPESHLYAPFTVPSKTMVKRWVLINVPTGRISRIAKLKIKTVEGDAMEYSLNLLKEK